MIRPTRELIAEYQMATEMHSNPTIGLGTPSGKELLARGEQVLPNLFHWLMWGHGGVHCMTLLHAITKHNPVPSHWAGCVPMMKAYWLVWGSEKGYASRTL